jgi:hypothetical protein
MGKGESLAGKRLAESTREVGSGVESGFVTQQGVAHTRHNASTRLASGQLIYPPATVGNSVDGFERGASGQRL